MAGRITGNLHLDTERTLSLVWSLTHLCGQNKRERSTRYGGRHDADGSRHRHRQEGLRSAGTAPGHRWAALLRRGHPHGGRRPPGRRGEGHQRHLLPPLPQQGRPGRRLHQQRRPGDPQPDRLPDDGGHAPDGILRAIGASLVGQIRSPGYRGCAFLNAAAEFPAPDHPVHRAVVQHREWFLQTITGLFADIAPARAEHAGRHFVMLRDGAMSAGYLGDPVVAGETLLRGIEGLLRVLTGGFGPGESAAAAPDQAPSAATPVSGIDCSPPST